MSTSTPMPRDIDAILDAWLEEGPTLSADRAVGAALANTEHIRQEGPFATRGLPMLLVAAVLMIALTLGVAVLLTQIPEKVEPTPTWRVLPSVEAPLEPGRYMVATPFRVRIGLTISEGWASNPLRETYAQVTYLGDGDEGGAAVFFTFVDGVYADPCHLEQGFIDPPLGPAVDDLASALAGLPGVAIVGPTDTTLGGLPAVTLTITAPAAFEGCTGQTDGPPFRLWGVPEWGAMEPGERLRLWIVAVGGERLVIGAREWADSSPGALAAMNALAASILLDPEGPVASASPLANEFCNPCTALPPDGRLVPGDYEFLLRLRRYDGDSPIRLDQPHRVTFEAGPDWSSTGAGVVSTDAPPGGGAWLTFWSVARIYVDPCNWQTSAVVNPSELGQLSSLADAFWQWWTPGAMAGAGHDPPPFAPAATEPIDETRYGNFAKRLELTIPPDLDVASCDGDEYRMWEDFQGRARRMHGPGERVSLWVIDLAPGLLVVDASTLPDTSREDRRELTELIPSLWVERPEDYLGR